jgi:hypothetical protein
VYLVRVAVAGCRDPAEDFPELRLIIDQLEK